MGATIQNLFLWGFFKFVWWRATEQYFNHRDRCTSPTLRSNIDQLAGIEDFFLRPALKNNIIQAFLGKSLGAHVEAGCHSMVGDFDLISSQDAKILHA